jgi:iron complex outermembrane receptor protein
VLFLVAGCTFALGLSGSTASAADETNQVQKMEPIVVTGSLIPTAETVGPAQLTTFAAADIEKIAAGNVLDLVKKLDPSFSGNGNIGQTLNNGGYGEANVQIRNVPTLVLLNGRRLGNSALSSAIGLGAVDLNTIPLAAIDRIEILKDGGSALYGSDAIGGVVNIITKKEFNEVDLDGYFGQATGKGTYTEERASVVTGFSTDKAQFTFAGQYYHSDPLYSTDRSIASLGLDALGKAGLSGSESYFSPSFPGKVQDSGGTWYLGNGFQTPPIVPGGPFTTVAAYNAAAVAAGYTQPYGTTPPSFASEGLLNTTQFGTVSIQSQDRRNLFGDGTYDLIGKQLQLYTTILYANLDSVGALAPSPVVGLATYQSNISIPAGNIYNPFGIDLGPAYGAAGLPPDAPRIRSRFWDSGNRIFDSSTDYYHVVAGLKGEFESGYTYDAGYTYNQYDQLLTTENAINGAALGLALQPNINPALAAAGLSQLQSASGGFVPQYNLFSYPGQNSPTTLDAIRTSLFEKGLSTDWSADCVLTGTPLDLPAGKLGIAVGGGIRSASLATDFDGLTRLGLVPGLNTTEPTSGTRDSYDLFAEVRLPLTSPEQHLPLLRSLEVTAAGRFESFSPGGDDIVPKVALRWQPLDEQVTFRASYSQSFIAPSTYQLFGGAAESQPVLADGNGNVAQESIAFVNNASLKAETSENYGAGVVISPKAIKGLTVSVDYYHIQVRNGIFQLGAQNVVNDLNAHGSASKYASLWTFANGTKLTSTAPNQVVDATWGLLDIPWANGSKTETEGIDFSATYEKPTESLGKFTFYVNANLTLDYLYGDPVEGGPYHYEGQYTDLQVVDGAQGTLPEYQITTGLTWEYKDFTYTISAHYIPQVTDKGDAFPLNGNPSKVPNDYTNSGKNWTVDSWFDIDMQIAYEFGRTKTQKSWYDGTKIAVGVNNITDEAPPLISSSSEDNTDKSTYDIIGRFAYVEVSKKF